MSSEFSPYYTEFQVIAGNLTSNPISLWNAVSLQLLKEMQDAFHYSNMADELSIIEVMRLRLYNQSL